jgi:hypothetical protein
MSGQETRNKLTDYWSGHGIQKGDEFAILTDLIHSEWAEVSVKEHKELKGLTTQNLRDHMSEAELIFTALAELTTRNVAEVTSAEGMHDNAEACVVGGRVSKNAREDFEDKTKSRVVSSKNFLTERRNTKELEL